mmetsp:Transcript_9275/g.16717  ORF Transcript_9275/g.16717 Transcript_9275/m.16717 type:complete len:246 (-) Transcript_9275:103-840(-)
MWSLQAAFVSGPSVAPRTPAVTTSAAPLQASKLGAVGAESSLPRGGLAGLSAVVGVLAGANARRNKALAKSSRRACKKCEAKQADSTTDDLFSRRNVAELAAALLFLVRSEEAEAKIIDDGENCRACAGSGLVVCPTCNGTGQYRLLNANSADGRTSMQAQFYDCPECRALGELCCPACYATGLPNKELRGFLRNPDFAEAVQFIKDNRVSPENIKDYQALVLQGLDRVKEKRAAKAAKKAEATA